MSLPPLLLNHVLIVFLSNSSSCRKDLISAHIAQNVGLIFVG
nr:MAG TPA: hypothetical protein [Caudoviricetes sp.]